MCEMNCCEAGQAWFSFFLNQDTSSTYWSSGSTAFIRFTGQHLTRRRGFLMTYVAVANSDASKFLSWLVWLSCIYLSHYTSIVANLCPSELPPSDGCDGGVKVISEESGILTSRRYPSLFPDNATCLYKIDLTGKSKIVTPFANLLLWDYLIQSLVVQYGSAGLTFVVGAISTVWTTGWKYTTLLTMRSTVGNPWELLERMLMLSSYCQSVDHCRSLLQRLTSTRPDVCYARLIRHV